MDEGGGIMSESLILRLLEMWGKNQVDREDLRNNIISKLISHIEVGKKGTMGKRKI